jgi:polyhydroxybutyrate depolymerase
MMSRFFAVLFLLGTVLLSSCFGQKGTSSPSSPPKTKPSLQKSWEKIKSGGRVRRYLLLSPKALEKGKLRPLLLLFHGAGSRPDIILRSSGFGSVAAQERFFIAAPEGTPKYPGRRARFFGNPRTWNDGSGRQNLGAVQQKTDDSGFIRRLIGHLKKTRPIDPKRVYACGFSNGASLTWFLGRRLNDCLAAIAPIAGADFAKKAPELPLPSLFYATGKKDPLNPFGGGPIHLFGKSAGKKPPVLDQLDRWRKAMGLPVKPIPLLLKGPIQILAWRTPKKRAEIRLLSIQDHGHLWPGARSFLPKRLIGPRNPAADQVRLAEKLWSFFSAHPRK